MGMKPYSYVAMGIKTTRQECKANGIDIYEQFEENEHISAIFGEDSDDVLIGHIVFEVSPHVYRDNVSELTTPDPFPVWEQLTNAGVECDLNEVKLYTITVWL